MMPPNRYRIKHIHHESGRSCMYRCNPCRNISLGASYDKLGSKLKVQVILEMKILKKLLTRLCMYYGILGANMVSYHGPHETPVPEHLRKH